MSRTMPSRLDFLSDCAQVSLINTRTHMGAALTGLSPCVVPKLYRLVFHTNTRTNTVTRAHNPSPTTHHTHTQHTARIEGAQHIHHELKLPNTTN